MFGLPEIFTTCNVSVAVAVLYLVFYTGYNKLTKKLDIGLLLSVLLGRHGADFTLVELNKVSGLFGITLFALSFIPPFREHQVGLLGNATLALWAHGTFSVLKYYGSSNIPAVNTWLSLAAGAGKPMDIVRVVSAITGSTALLVLTIGYWGWVSLIRLSWLGLLLGVVHFITMELNHKWRLSVRPFAYLPFVLVPLAILCAQLFGAAPSF